MHPLLIVLGIGAVLSLLEDEKPASAAGAAMEGKPAKSGKPPKAPEEKPSTPAPSSQAE